MTLDEAAQAVRVRLNEAKTIAKHCGMTEKLEQEIACLEAELFKLTNAIRARDSIDQ